MGIIGRAKLIDSGVNSAKIDADAVIPADVDETQDYNWTGAASTYTGALFAGTLATVTTANAVTSLQNAGTIIAHSGTVLGDTIGAGTIPRARITNTVQGGTIDVIIDAGGDENSNIAFSPTFAVAPAVTATCNEAPTSGTMGCVAAQGITTTGATITAESWTGGVGATITFGWGAFGFG